jgi:hypothetical protein
MNFPFEPVGLGHAHGGMITRVHSIKHEVYRPRDGRSCDYWYFADVAWNDGSKSEATQVSAHHLCADGGATNPAVSQLFDALNDYLNKNGSWSYGTTQDGWYAYDRSGERRRA